jgi:TldD protein
LVQKNWLLAPVCSDRSAPEPGAVKSLSHGADDADLYFQYTRSGRLEPKKLHVKTGSFSIDQGVGVRALSGENRLAYSDDISEASLL